VLPSGIPTHEHSTTKKWSRLDQEFLSDCSDVTLIACDMLPEERGINMDHLPILTELDLTIATIVAEPVLNFWNTNWEDFRTELKGQLNKTPILAHITN